MGLIEWRRRRMLDYIVNAGMTYGAYVFYKKPEFEWRDETLWRSVPEVSEHVTEEKKVIAAKKSIEHVSDRGFAQVWKAHRFLKNGLKNRAYSHELYTRIEEQELDRARADALVMLLRNGLENDPAFAAIAAATSVSEVTTLRVKATVKN